MTGRRERGQRLVLGTHINPLIGETTWRHPLSAAEFVYDIDEYRKLATAAERASLDFILTPDGPRHEPGVVEYAPVRILDALVLLSVLAGSTESIGLIPTISTTFNDPFTVARQLLSLQHLARGRVGWNVVTSTGGAEHYGAEPLLEHDLRYRRADEFLRVTALFWESWSEGALLRDRASGRWTDRARIDAFDFQGEFFTVRGPLSLPADPVGRPVVVQAGASPAGISLGSKHAELVYALNYPSPQAKEFYTRFKRSAEGFGRHADDVLITPAISPIVADTVAEAQEIARERALLVNVEQAVSSLGASLGGIDLLAFDLDEPLPEHALPSVDDYNGQKSIIVNLRRRAYDEKLTLRALVTGNRINSSDNLVGTPESIADVLIAKFEAYESDGFTFTAPDLPGGHHDILEKLVPVLVERGYFVEGYTERGLRERLRAATNAPSLVP